MKASLLHQLLRQVSAVSGAQALRHCFNDDPASMQRNLRAQLKAGLISVSTELLRNRDTSGPIVVIERGAGLPSPHPIAYEAARRWSNNIRPELIIRGTLKLAALHGGVPHAAIAGHASHEIALTEVFLTKRSQDPSFGWTLVQSAPGNGALPDAISAEAAIELIGRYNGTTIAAKLGISATHRLELW